MPGPRPPRLLIYSQDGLGLGHLRRTSLLAAEFLRRQPGASVLTLCDSPLGQFFSSAPGHDFVKLPSVRKLRPGEWSPVSLSAPFSDVIRLRAELIRTAALEFRPDVLLVDHMPHGAMGELLPTLEALEDRPVRMVLGLRDILDAPETVRQRWHVEGAFEAVDRYFGDVLVYGSQDVFDVAEQYAWPDRIRSRLSYCGYVCSSTAGRPRIPAQGIRRRLGPGGQDGDLVVAMAGGGADAGALFETLLRATPLVLATRKIAVVVVTGPFFPEADRSRLRQLAADLPVRVMTSVQDPLSYLRAADLVVTMAGYNTTAEILSVGGRALLVPRAGPSAEQRTRASRFADRGWVRWLPPDQLAPRTLADAVLDALGTAATPVAVQPDLQGRHRAAGQLAGAGPR